MEAVPLWVFEVDELHHRVALAGDFVAVDLGLEEKGVDRLVGFEQGAVGLAQDLGAQVVELAVGQPGDAGSGTVDGADGLAEDLGEEPFAEGLAQAGGRVGGDEALALVDDHPA